MDNKFNKIIESIVPGGIESLEKNYKKAITDSTKWEQIKRASYKPNKVFLLLEEKFKKFEIYQNLLIGNELNIRSIKNNLSSIKKLLEEKKLLKEIYVNNVKASELKNIWDSLNNINKKIDEEITNCENLLKKYPIKDNENYKGEFEECRKLLKYPTLILKDFEKLNEDLIKIISFQENIQKEVQKNEIDNSKNSDMSNYKKMTMEEFLQENIQKAKDNYIKALNKEKGIEPKEFDWKSELIILSTMLVLGSFAVILSPWTLLITIPLIIGTAYYRTKDKENNIKVDNKDKALPQNCFNSHPNINAEEKNQYLLPKNPIKN